MAIQVSPNIVDNLVGVFSPRAKNNRIQEKLKFAALSETGYLVPGSNRNSMKGTNVSPGSPDRDTAPKIRGSRGLSRDLTMNSPLGAAAVKRARTNIIGPGLLPQPTLDHEALGISEEQADAWEKNVDTLFNLWADSKLCDFTRRLDFWSMQRLVVYSFLQNGDCFAIPVFSAPSRSGLWPFELRVRLVEADLVRNPLHYQNDFIRTDGKDIVSGIEQGANGQIIAAWFADHYDDYYNFARASRGKFTRMESHDINGRANYLHIMDPDRISQRRGMPFLAPVTGILKQITRLGEAELQATIVSSMFTVFIKDADATRAMPNEAITPSDALFGGGSVTDADGNQTQVAKDAGHEWENEMGAGTITNLDDNKEIEIADPRKISEGFEPFYNAMVTEFSAALEIPKEQLLLHFSSSYTAARAAFIEAWKFYKTAREFIARSFCQPIYEEFLTEAIAKGWVVAPGFLDDPIKRKQWASCQWIGPGNGELNPLVEKKAAVFGIENNLSNHSREYNAANGGKWTDMMTRRSREQKVIEKMNLIPPEQKIAQQQNTGTTTNGDDGGDNAGNDDE